MLLSFKFPSDFVKQTTHLRLIAPYHVLCVGQVCIKSNAQVKQYCVWGGDWVPLKLGNEEEKPYLEVADRTLEGN